MSIYFLARGATLGAANTAVQLSAIIAALVPTPKLSPAFTQLTLINNGAGNLGVTDDSTVAGEAGTAILPSGSSQNFNTSGSPSDVINTTEIWLISATLNQAFSIFGRSEVG